MRIGIFIGLLIKLTLAILPAILVLFSDLVSGRTKAKWFLITLVTPYALKEVVFALIYTFQKETLVMNGPVVLGGYSPLIPLTWYISAWVIYFYFKKKYKNKKE